MASRHLANVSHAWEKYTESRAHGADPKVTLQRLEHFLSLFHWARHLQGPDSKDALKFCSDMSGASNTLAREFLTDVHQLCSAVAQRAEEEDEEEEESHMLVLGEYLVKGQGYLLLSTLESVIDQELTCREELLTLLLSLLPLVWRIPVQEERAPDFTLPLIADVLFIREGRGAAPLRPGQEREVSDAQDAGKRCSGSWKARRQRRAAQRYSVRDARKSQLSTSDSDANSDDKSGGPGGKHRRSHGPANIPAYCHQPQPATASTDAMSALERAEPQPRPRLFGGPQGPGSSSFSEAPGEPAVLSAVVRADNSPFDLCRVLLSLLEKVCKFDTALNHNPGLAVSVVPALTEMLTEFGDCCGPGGGAGGDLARGWTEEPIALVQRMLLRSVLHLMSLGVSQGEALPDHLRQNLTDLLRATLKIRSGLERQADPFAPRPKRTLQEVRDEFSFSRRLHRALLLPELLEGVLRVLLGCLQVSASNPFFLGQAVELVQEFVRHRGLELLEVAVLGLEAPGAERDPAVGAQTADRARALVGGVVRIISAVKKAKAEQLHQSVCARRRHRRCQYSHFLHHHRDLSGLPASAFRLASRQNPFEDEEQGEEGEGEGAPYPERCCCLAACAHRCLRLLRRLPAGGPASLEILAGLQAVGVCCCMDPRSVVGPLLAAFRAPGLRPYQTHVLAVLSRLILEQLGGGQLSERARQASCNICTLEEPLGGTPPPPSSSSSLSPSSRGQGQAQGVLPNREADDALWKWEALQAYQELAFGGDPQLALQTAGHVCQLALRGNAAVQWQLYAHIFNPALQRGVDLAHRAHELEGSAPPPSAQANAQAPPIEVLQVYLQTLPALLKTRPIRDLFLSCNGLNQVTELMYLDQVRSSALKVFETLILSLGAEQEQEAEEPEADLDLGARGAGDGPQSLSKFYEGLKEAGPQQRGKSRAGHGKGGAGAHLNAINLFLCVAFLCVSKEPDSDRDSANDSEDTSGYDSTASEPLGARLPRLSPDSVALPSREQVRRAADVWGVCRGIYLSSSVFQRQFHKLGGLEACSRLLAMVIQTLASRTKEGKGKKKREAKGRVGPTTPDDHPGPDPVPDQGETNAPELKGKDPARRLEEEWPLQSIRLLEALLSICLHSSSPALQRADPQLSFQLQSVDETLVEVRDQLSRSGVVTSDLAVPLFDSLLRVALAETSTGPDPLEERTERKLHSDEGAGPPSESLSQDADEPEDRVIWLPGEEGYEADSESNLEGTANREEGAGTEACPAGERAFGAGPEGSGGRGELLYPEICTMELQLLSSGGTEPEVLPHVFKSLLETVRNNPHNATLLYHQGAVKTILGGFQSILSRSDSHSEECQAVLVELLVAMVSLRITAEELALLVRLFLEKTPPTEILLNGLLRIVEANMDMEPLQFLSFPLSPPGGAASPGGGSSSLSPVGQNCWPHMADGFSTSLWIRARGVAEEEGPAEKGRRLRKRAGALRDSSVDSLEGVKPPGLDVPSPAVSGDPLVEEGYLHVVSMGSKALMLQVWADLTTGAFTFRICIDPNDEMRAGLLAQAESPKGLLEPGRWQHLAFTYSQHAEGKKHVQGTLTLWVCGVRRCEVSLDYTVPRRSSLSSDSNKTLCMLGHHTHTLEDLARLGGRWDIGSLLLFNGSRVGSEEAFYLYASGPDFTSVMPCKYGKPKDKFSKYVTRDGLQCEQVRDLLMKNKDVDTGPLIESLAVVYAPSCPGQYTIYEPIIRLKGQTKMVATQRPFSSKEVLSSSLEPQFLRALRPTEPQGLQSVLHKIGGTGTFVFLFARAVELSDCEKTQALALQVLLSLVKYNQHRVHEMESCHGFSMIHQVLIKSKCIVGYHMLKTLLDGCCSGQILALGEDGEFHLDTDSSAVVQDVRLMSEILLDWKIWAKAQSGVWETLLVALEVLIRVHHPQQMYNIRQLLNAQVVHRFLLTCQVLQEHRDEHLFCIPQEVCLSFIKIIQEVLGSPPDLDLLRLVYNFLLAVHPPTNTYVCHTPSSFYFSLHIDGKLYQEKVQSLMFLRNSSSGGRSACSSVVSLSPTGFAEPHPEDLGLNHTPEPEGGGQSLKPPPFHPLSLLLPRHPPANAEGAEPGQAAPRQRAAQLGSTETLRRSCEEPLLSSCESAKTLCDYCPPTTPSISVEEEPEEEGEEPEGRRPGAAGPESPGDGSGEDRLDSAGDEALRRPDSLKGIQSFQRSQSNLASLGLAFPAQNGSLAIGRWPSLADRANALPEDWESYTFSPGYERARSKADSTDRSSAEDCLVLVCCGLYDLLRGVLLLLPDLMLEEVMDRLVQPEALIVLVNHSSPLIQQGVMKLLDAYFSRAVKEQKEKFLKNHGFSLLANQLYIHQGSQGLLESFLEMLFGRPVGLEEDLDMEDMENINPFRKRCIIPVLGLIENSLYESTLVHNALCVLQQLLNTCPKLGDILLDHGLLYVLFNTLATLNGMENGIPLDDYKLLVCDIQQLLVAVTIHSCSSSGFQYFRIIEDLITLLGYLQTSKIRRTQEMAVALQFRVLQSAIEFIRSTANQDPQKLGGSMHLSTPPHHALHQKRKSIAGSVAVSESIFPLVPLHHRYSYGLIPPPSPFTFLSQGTPLPSPAASPSYALPPDAGRRRFSLVPSDSLLSRMRSVATDELTQMMQRRMSQENPIRASESELIQRLQRLVLLAVNRLVYQDVSQDLFDLLNIPESPTHRSAPGSPREALSEENGAPPPPANIRGFQKEILKLMMEGIKVGLGGSSRGGAPRQQWRRILWSCRDTFRQQIGRLLVHTLSPARPLEDRRQALEFVYEPSHPDILRESISPGPEHGPKLALYLSAATAVPPLNAPPKPELVKAMKEDQLKYEAEEGGEQGIMGEEDAEHPEEPVAEAGGEVEGHL
ncbi:hypothetical protein SKAU_G00148160 [Synaphobranchus kaupii]|uniref:Lysosomal trafficking regulator n=1 Tax=Synaphobranchus kaupii TaxID=118154 RepID=A0A9Q1FUK0_SYNKA|nr:hypothetical protein SKAU_G00148160 [Synaphobranchus kaupii]